MSVLELKNLKKNRYTAISISYTFRRHTMKTSVTGFPRIGKLRELKFAEEKYFRKEISHEELMKVADSLKK